jgi:adenylate cyclase class 2
VNGAGGTEIEIKIRVADLAGVRVRLELAGAVLESPRHFESNTLFDDSSHRLSNQQKTLRLRRAAGRAVLTFKGPVTFFGDVKSRSEVETTVGDPEALEEILRSAGFLPAFVYEKFREEYRLGSAVVCLDETPLGNFVEIESDPDSIEDLRRKLGLRAEDAVRQSYARLYFEERERHPDLPSDMRFS